MFLPIMCEMWYSAVLMVVLLPLSRYTGSHWGPEQDYLIYNYSVILYNACKNVEVLWIIGLMNSITPCVYHDTVKHSTKTRQKLFSINTGRGWAEGKQNQVLQDIVAGDIITVIYSQNGPLSQQLWSDRRVRRPQVQWWQRLTWLS